MNKIYVVVETIYTGPRFCFEFDIKNQTEIGDCCEQACEKAFEEYCKIPENQDVPTAELYNSVQITECSSIRPVGY